MKKLIAALLAVLMIVSVFMLTSCENNTPTEPSTDHSSEPTSSSKETEPSPSASELSTEPSSNSDITPSAEPSSSSSSDTPDVDVDITDGNDGKSKLSGYEDVDFGGRTFTFLTVSDYVDEVGRWCNKSEVFVESRTGGTIVNTAVYDRNQVLKSLYNCNIVALETPSGSTLIQNDITSGTSEYDLLFQQAGFFQTNKEGYYYNMYDLDLDFDIPGWDIPFIEDITAYDSNGNKKLYSISGDYNLVMFRATWTLACNLDLYNANFEENIFDIVENREWTFDKLIEICTKVRKDTNGDSTWTVGTDTFGLLTTSLNIYGLITSAGLNFVERDDTGKFTSSAEILKANNASDVFDKIIEMYKTEGINTSNGSTSNKTELEDGRALFKGGTMDILERSSDSDVNIAILPMPLYDATVQDTYYSHVNSKACALKVSKNAADGDMNMISDFMNLYTFHSHMLVYPEFIKLWGSVYCNDPRNEDMIKLIIENRNYDYSYFSNTGVYAQAGTIASGNNQLSRAATKWAKTITDKLAVFQSDIDASK